MTRTDPDTAGGGTTASTTGRSGLRGIDPKARRALLASWLGWTFDGFETYALILIGHVAISDIGSDSQVQNLPTYVSALVAATLVGWAIGGVASGFLADRFGRRRILMVSILWYAVFTGLTALAPNYWWLLVLRLITGAGLGAEWGAGTSLIGELWKPRSRGRAAAILQSGFGVGALLAASVWYFLEPLGESAWRYLFVVGALPAAIVVYVRRSVDDSSMWKESQRLREAAKDVAAQGQKLTEGQAKLVRSPFAAVFSDPPLRRRGLVLFVLCVNSVIGLYAVSSWVPAFVGQLARGADMDAGHWASTASLTFNGASIAGYIVLGVLADLIGRKPTMLLYYLGSLIVVPVLFLGTDSPAASIAATAAAGFFILGQFAWMPIYMPELFPTFGRATATSAIFNAARLAGAAVTLLTGFLITALGSIGTAATVVGVTVYAVALTVVWAAGPETRGTSLPR
ncbi:MAG: MFS transporter [Mycobacterium sp.]